MHSQSSSISSLDTISLYDVPGFRPQRRRRKATVYRKTTIVESHREVFRSMPSVLRRFSSFGRYQTFCCIIVLYSTLFWSGNFMILPHTMTDNSWYCFLPPLNQTLHLDIRQPGFCEKIVNCSSLMPDHSYFNSIIIEWHLVCEKRFISSLLMLCYLCGRLLGSLISGHLADSLGRVWGYVLIQSILLVSSMMSIASTDWRAFAIFQFFNGYIFGHMKTTCITLLIETTDGKYRLVPFACIQWGLGFMINSIVLYLANDWRMFIVIVNLISSPLIYFYLLFQESYRWLLARGDLRGAADVMTELNSERWAKGDRENNVDGEITSEQLIMLLPDNESKRNFHSCFYLFLEKSTCRTTIVLMLMMVTYGMVGSWFHSGNDAISVDINIHFLLHGALTFWISSVIVLLDLKVPKLGYKPQLLFGMSLLAVCFAVTLFFNVTSYQAPRHIIYIATSIAAITDSSIVLMMICHTTAAVYPTVVRSKAFGLLFACENLGSIIMTILLSDYFSNGPVVGHFTCEALVIGAVLLAILYFPETKFMITREFLIDVFPTYNSNIGQS